MKQAQNARKQRGRSTQRKGGRNSGSGPGNRSENKVRGNPKQLLEKYKTQARDALQSGDRVTAEYYLQFADHYQRVLNDMQAKREQNSGDDQDGQNRRGRGRGRDRGGRPAQDNNTSTNAAEAEANQPEESETQTDPSEAAQPAEVHPELNLDGGEADDKPKRRAPRRRRPVKSAEEASADAPSAPEGGEAE
jgi:hypothetical protein